VRYSITVITIFQLFFRKGMQMITLHKKRKTIIIINYNNQQQL